MPSTIQNFAKNLRFLRLKSKLTQDQVAELVGSEIKFYQKLEGGRKADLRIGTVERFAAAYGLKAWHLLAPPRICQKARFKKPQPKAAAPRGPRKS